jgi:3-isopropylmalate dehydrogenase
MKRYKVVLLSGDGIGPEISEISIKILKKLSKKYGFNLDIKEEYFGGIAYEKHNDPAPKETLDQCKASDAVLLACVGDLMSLLELDRFASHKLSHQNILP